MTKLPWRYWFVYLCTFIPDVLFVWPAVLVVWALWGTDLHWNFGLWCRLKPDSWPTRTWYRQKIKGAYFPIPEKYRERLGTWLTWGGTTFGHGGFYGPGAGEITEKHELIHVEQYEVIMTTVTVLSLVHGLAGTYIHSILGNWLTALATLLIGFLLKAASGWLVAWLRGENPYMGSEHEESAYAQIELAELKNATKNK